MMPRHTPKEYRGADFVAIEKNLASLGYFTPSNKRIRTQTTKAVTFTKIVDGERLQARATIIPGATLGLPTTADQDKYIALQKIVMDSRKRHGEVRNPIGFYIYLVKGNIRPPELFVTSRTKAIFSKQKQAREQEIEKQDALELAYEDFRNQILDSYIAENYSGEKYQVLIEGKRQELSPQYRQFTYWKPEALMKFLETSVRTDLEKGLSLHFFDSFCKNRNSAELTF